MGKKATTTAARADLRGSLFGVFQVETHEGLTLDPKNRRASLLLAILFLQPDHSIGREALARLLWHDRFPAQAKASLRQCLSDLRKYLDGLEIDALIVTRNEVALVAESLSSDLIDLEKTLSEGSADQAAERLLAIGNLPLLEGITLNPEFDAWLAGRRDHIDTRIKTAIGTAMEFADPAARQRLLEASKARFPTLKSAGLVQTQTVLAILPFHEDEGLGNDLFLADGVVDELSSRLSGVEGVALVGRASITAVADGNTTLPQMATKLGASHLIEGRVRRRDDKIEVRVALIDGASGTELWAEQVTGAVTDFFEGRKVIGSNVIASMGKALGLTLTLAPSRRMTADREAYSLYLQGSALGQRIGVEGAIARGIELLKRALDIDPEFAECWTALADAHIMTAAVTPSLSRVAQSTEGAVCAERALALDPGQGHAFSVLGVHEWTQFNPARALEMALEAYARDPGSSNVASRLGSCLLYLGKTQEALPYVEEAVDRDPIYWRNLVMLLSAYLGLGQLEEARQTGQRMVDMGAPGMFLAIAQSALGDREAAIKSHYDCRFYLDTVLMRPPGVAPMDEVARDAYFNLAARGIHSGEETDRAAYCQLLGGLHATMPDPYDHSIAMPAIWMGHTDLVMKIYSERIHPANMFGLMTLWIDIDPINRTIRHPDFMAFAEKIGMVEAWNRFGWPDLIPSDPRLA
ncbi:MAG: tetratricopeptide repeat protein [Pseudomonadota bacterium]